MKSARDTIDRYDREERRFMWGISLICATVVVFCGWALFDEHAAQEANEVRCEAAGGAYYRNGDKRDSGICVRRDSLIWRKL